MSDKPLFPAKMPEIELDFKLKRAIISKKDDILLNWKKRLAELELIDSERMDYIAMKRKPHNKSLKFPKTLVERAKRASNEAFDIIIEYFSFRKKYDKKLKEFFDWL